MAAITQTQNNSIISSFFGLHPYGVLIEPSEGLTALLESAQDARELPFDKKLEAIEQLAVGAMENAYEGMFIGDASRKSNCYSMVRSQHSLTEALKSHLGCCRYQATLFFLLAAEAQLGTKHYLQSVRIKGGPNTCFNDVYDQDGKVHHVSIFTKSLKDQKYNYSTDLTLFNYPNEYLPGEEFLAYTIDETGQFIPYHRMDYHFDSYQNKKMQIERFEAMHLNLTTQLQAMTEDHKDYTITQSNINKCTLLIENFRSSLEKFTE